MGCSSASIRMKNLTTKLCWHKIPVNPLEHENFYVILGYFSEMIQKFQTKLNGAAFFDSPHGVKATIHCIIC